jgi:TolA-binding protein
MRSIQGQAGGNDLKKGKGRNEHTSSRSFTGGRANDALSGTLYPTADEFTRLEKSGAPPFLVKTYQLITTCDDSLAEWSEDGDTFVIKNANRFAKEEIPKYFEHSNFSSFSRQLNFYGFKKVPQKTVRIDQKNDEQSYVRFYNEKFKRGRIDLLSQIQRSTKTGGTTANQAQEIKVLKDRVTSLETQLSNMQYDFEALQNQVKSLLLYQQQQQQQQQQQHQQQQQQQQQPQQSISANVHPSSSKIPYANAPMSNNLPNGRASSVGMNIHAQVYQPSQTYSSGPSHPPSSSSSSTSAAPPSVSNYSMHASARNDSHYSPMMETSPDRYTKYPSATLEPHPKTKQLDPNHMPPPPPGVRGVSRGVSLLRGLSSAFDGDLFNAVMSDEGLMMTSPVSPPQQQRQDKMQTYASMSGDPLVESNMVRMNSLNLSDNFQRDEKVLGV